MSWVIGVRALVGRCWFAAPVPLGAQVGCSPWRLFSEGPGATI